MFRPKRMAIAQLAVTALLVTGAMASTSLKHQLPANFDPASPNLASSRKADLPAAIRGLSNDGAAMEIDAGAYAELEPQPQNMSEQDKLARAREAIAAATAAGTRGVDAHEHTSPVLGDDAAAQKLILRDQQEPRQLSVRPGVSAGDQGGGR